MLTFCKDFLAPFISLIVGIWIIQIRRLMIRKQHISNHNGRKDKSKKQITFPHVAHRIRVFLSKKKDRQLELQNNTFHSDCERTSQPWSYLIP
jgi:hypothetical protein